MTEARSIVRLRLRRLFLNLAGFDKCPHIVERYAVALSLTNWDIGQLSCVDQGVYIRFRTAEALGGFGDREQTRGGGLVHEQDLVNETRGEI